MERRRQVIKTYERRDFPGGPVVKNPSCNAGEAGSVPCRGTKTPHAMGQLSLRAATREPTCSGACTPQLESSSCATVKSPLTAVKDPVHCNKDLT